MNGRTAKAIRRTARQCADPRKKGYVQVRADGSIRHVFNGYKHHIREIKKGLRSHNTL